MHPAFLHPDSPWQLVLALLIEYGVFIVAAVGVFTLAFMLLKNFFGSGRHRD